MNYNIKISELNKLNPHMTPGLNGTQVTLVEGERSRSLTILAPQNSNYGCRGSGNKPELVSTRYKNENKTTFVANLLKTNPSISSLSR